MSITPPTPIRTFNRDTVPRTKAQVARALNAAGFGDLTIWWSTSTRHWYFVGGTSHRWYQSTPFGATAIDCLSLGEWVDAAIYCHSCVGFGVGHWSEDSDHGDDTLTIIDLVDCWCCRKTVPATDAQKRRFGRMICFTCHP